MGPGCSFHLYENGLPWIACTWGCTRPSDTNPDPTRFHLNPDAPFGVVGQIHTEFCVEVVPVVRVGFGEHGDDVMQRLDEGPYLRSGELAAGDGAPELGFQVVSLSLDLGHPSGDDLGVGVGVEYRLVLIEPSVAVVDLFETAR